MSPPQSSISVPQFMYLAYFPLTTVHANNYLLSQANNTSSKKKKMFKFNEKPRHFLVKSHLALNAGKTDKTNSYY